jgi:primary-amine oxidase
MSSEAFFIHPFDPISGPEIQLAVSTLKACFPGVALRFKRIDVQEPLKKDTVPYLEAERLRLRRPLKPARLLQALFHRLDNRSFFKATINADTQRIVVIKELPIGVQVITMDQFSVWVLWTDLDVLIGTSRRG